MDTLRKAMILIEESSVPSDVLLEQLELLGNQTPDDDLDKFGDIWEAYIAKFGPIGE